MVDILSKPCGTKISYEVLDFWKFFEEVCTQRISATSMFIHKYNVKIPFVHCSYMTFHFHHWIYVIHKVSI